MTWDKDSLSEGKVGGKTQQVMQKQSFTTLRKQSDTQPVPER